MINKVAFSKAIKDSKRKDRIFNDDEFICNGYWVFKKDNTIKEVLTKEFLTSDNFIYEHKEVKKENINLPKIKSIVEDSPKNEEFEFSGLIRKDGDNEYFVFIGKTDNVPVIINRKFVEVIDDLKNCKILGGNSKVQGLNFLDDKGNFLGYILPIRPVENDFIVTRK